jgi:hypothetical protein
MFQFLGEMERRVTSAFGHEQGDIPSQLLLHSYWIDRTAQERTSPKCFVVVLLMTSMYWDVVSGVSFKPATLG